ncbi:MAG: hypothetical protein EBX90_00690 [Betaproteobacteria bacterium]|nr:hypothetical protein [Betaproteobacteria bacterium]
MEGIERRLAALGHPLQAGRSIEGVKIMKITNRREAMGLMASAAFYLRWLVWPATIAGIVLAANATWLIPMMFHRKVK